MKPLSDGELDHLLGLWIAPTAPQSLEEKIFARRSPWWAKLLDSIVRTSPFKNRRHVRRRKRKAGS